MTPEDCEAISDKVDLPDRSGAADPFLPAPCNLSYGCQLRLIEQYRVSSLASERRRRSSTGWVVGVASLNIGRDALRLLQQSFWPWRTDYGWFAGPREARAIKSPNDDLAQRGRT